MSAVEEARQRLREAEAAENVRSRTMPDGYIDRLRWLLDKNAEGFNYRTDLLTTLLIRVLIEKEQGK